MAKKNETKNPEGTAPSEAPVATTTETPDEHVIQPSDTTDNADTTDKADITEPVEGATETVKCVALLITLRTSHPLDSYGRCGYRFNKETPVRSPIADIPSEAIGVFDNDPYLDCEYECE